MIGGCRHHASAKTILIDGETIDVDGIWVAAIDTPETFRRAALVALAVRPPHAATEVRNEKQRGTRHSPVRANCAILGSPPMNRSDVIDPETKSRGATPS